MSHTITAGWAVGLASVSDESAVVMVTVKGETIGMTPDFAEEMAKVLLLMAAKAAAVNAEKAKGGAA